METKQKSMETRTGAVHREWSDRMDTFKNAARGAVVGAVIAVSAAGCATYQQNGQLLGGALGGVIGSQIGQGEGRAVATIIGTLAGAYIGGSIGRSMDRQDQINAYNAITSNPIGRPSYWANQYGNRYQVTPTQQYVPQYGQNAGQVCRSYVTTGFIGGQAQTIKGVACQQPDGSWKME
jgi:surface antigen